MTGRLTDDEAAWDTVGEAWSERVRCFDTAPLYGRGLSERRIGSALAGQDREEFVLSTKIGLLLDEDRYDYGYDTVVRSVDVGRRGKVA